MLLSERLLTNRSLFRVSQNLCPMISCHDFQVRIGQRMWNTLFQLWSRVGQGAFDSDIWSGIRNIFPGNIPGKIFEEWIPLLDAKKTIQNEKIPGGETDAFLPRRPLGAVLIYTDTHIFYCPNFRKVSCLENWTCFFCSSRGHHFGRLNHPSQSSLAPWPQSKIQKGKE